MRKIFDSVESSNEEWEIEEIYLILGCNVKRTRARFDEDVKIEKRLGMFVGDLGYPSVKGIWNRLHILGVLRGAQHPETGWAGTVPAGPLQPVADQYAMVFDEKVRRGSSGCRKGVSWSLWGFGFYQNVFIKRGSKAKSSRGDTPISALD